MKALDILKLNKAMAGGWTFDISNSTYDSKSFSVSSRDNDPLNIFFKPDGTKMYIIGGQYDRVQEFSLSTAWDVSTASYVDYYYYVSLKYPTSITFKPDGTKMYIIDNQKIYQFSLSTAWDVSTASYEKNYSNSNIQRCISFNENGTKMYFSNYAVIFQYSLSTAWDVSTASYDNKSFDTSKSILDFILSPDGKSLVIIGYSLSPASSELHQYSLSTAWDVSTASYDNKSLNIYSQEVYPKGFFINNDGEKMYYVGGYNKTIYQYSLT